MRAELAAYVQSQQLQSCGSAAAPACFTRTHRSTDCAPLVQSTGNESYMSPRGMAVVVPRTALQQRLTGISAVARFRHDWRHVNASSPAGVFSVSAHCSGGAAGPALAQTALQLWAVRTPASVTVALQHNGTTIEASSPFACPAGVWASLGLVVNPAVAELRLLGWCGGGLGEYDVSVELPRAAWPHGNVSVTAMQIWPGLYGVPASSASLPAAIAAAQALPMRGADVAALALYSSALSEPDLALALSHVQAAEHAGNGAMLCAKGAAAYAQDCAASSSDAAQCAAGPACEACAQCSVGAARPGGALTLLLLRI